MNGELVGLDGVLFAGFFNELGGQPGSFADYKKGSGPAPVGSQPRTSSKLTFVDINLLGQTQREAATRRIG